MPDFEGTVSFLDPRSGGRRTPALSNYRPTHRLHENYLSSGMHEYLDVEAVHPGETARVAVWLIAPEVYPGCLWVGREIDVCEGERKVGSVRVDRLFNEVLRGTPETYQRLWCPAQGLERD